MNKVLQSMKIAFRALRVNKLRSALTMLGIIIGVGAVIAMVSIGNAATDRIHQAIAAIGSNVIIVQPGSQNTGGVKSGNGNAQTLTEEDAKAIPIECPAVMYSSPLQQGNQQVAYQNNNWGTKIYGVTPDYLTIRDIEVDQGASFTMQDVDGTTKVALLGKTVADNLFPDEGPIGKVVRINKVPFTVVGTLVPKGQSSTGQDRRRPGRNAHHHRQEEGYRRAAEQSIDRRPDYGASSRRAGCRGGGPDRVLLRQRHLNPTTTTIFQVRSLEVAAAQEQQASIALGLLLASIASGLRADASEASVLSNIMLVIP